MTATSSHEPRPVVPRSTPSRASAGTLAPALDALLAVRAEGLAPLVSWDRAEAPLLTHEVPAGAVTLASLRDVGPLRSGHVLHVARSVCSALVALHAVGLAHGAVGSEQVLVAPDGDVVLAATGAAWADVPGTPLGPRAADDVLGLGEMLRLLLGRGAAPGSLVIAALRAVDADPHLRPDAAALRELLEVCGRAEPLLGPLWGSAAEPPQPPPSGPAAPPPAAAPPPGDAAPRPAARARRRPGRIVGRGERLAVRAPAEDDRPSPGRSRRRAAAARRKRLPVVLASLAALAVGGLAVRAAPLMAAAAQAPRPAPSGAQAVPAAPAPIDPGGFPLDPAAATDWAALLSGLDAGRRRALASGSEDELARWVSRDGAAWAADLALLRRLSASGAALRGGALELESVQVRRSGTDVAVLDVRDRRAAYDVVMDGAAQHVAQRPSSVWTVTLTRDDGGWRIADVVPG